MLRQAVTPHRAVEGLDEAVVHRLAGPGKVELYPVLVGPGIQRGRLTNNTKCDRPV